ncbi:protein of unknown function [Legionella micdadei]|uniref:Uncharacterized protein n=1 Tax=Legionella micdadei TaxID=451 RepID=A0A098GLJ7_LEGMI|nr:protein of unknown function [Legionella micdadei]
MESKNQSYFFTSKAKVALFNQDYCKNEMEVGINRENCYFYLLYYLILQEVLARI